MHPQTKVTATQGDKKLFWIDADRLRPEGLKRLLRLEKYNLYKKELQAAAIDAGLDLLDLYFDIKEMGGHYLQIKFYVPVPHTWRKWQREKMHLQPMESTPDWDNMAKAIQDALIPKEPGSRRNDKIIADIRITKIWFHDSKQYIKIKQPDGKWKIENEPKGFIEFWQRIDA